MHPATHSQPSCRRCVAPDPGRAGFDIPAPEGSAWLCEACAEAAAPRCDLCAEPIWPTQAPASVSIRRDSAELALVHGGCAPSHVLRCVWAASDEYGGPEEGGWHYEAGRLLAAVPVPLLPALSVDLAAEAAADALLQRAFAHVESRRTRLKFTVALELPESSFPQSRPHYE